jgi:hypothetical protein
VSWRSKRQNGAVVSIQIKDVPEETHHVLRRRALEAHQSLQEYLRARLIEQASRPTVDEVLARAGNRSGGRLTLSEATQLLAEQRDRH